MDSNSEVGLSKALSVVVGKEIRLNEVYTVRRQYNKYKNHFMK